MPGPDPDHGARRDGVTWRGRVRAHPAGRRAYRLAVAVVGTVVVVVGLVLIPAPGPGWVIVFAGLAVLATEFAWARRLLDHSRDRVKVWSRWTARQGIAVRGLLAVASAALLLVLCWALLALAGVPSWLPEGVRTPLTEHVPGL